MSRTIASIEHARVAALHHLVRRRARLGSVMAVVDMARLGGMGRRFGHRIPQTWWGTGRAGAVESAVAYPIRKFTHGGRGWS